MPTLTRRRDPNSREEAWLIFYGDVHVGTIGMGSGNPTGGDQWSWHCGFYPGSNPGDATNGTATNFDEARAAFESAWSVFLSKRTEADFQEYRRGRASTAWKYSMWDTGCKLPTQTADGRARCFCGAKIRIEDRLIHRHEKLLDVNAPSPPRQCLYSCALPALLLHAQGHLGQSPAAQRISLRSVQQADRPHDSQIPSLP